MQLSKNRAASTLGINQSNYLKIESGEVRPGLKIATRIERITNGQVRCIDWYPGELCESA